MFMKKLSCGVSLAAIALVSATAVHAQETTGGIRGQVFDAAGNAVAGASVTVLHQPSGTSSTTMTDQNGGYSVRNLRVGGPYVVTVQSAQGAGFSALPAVAIGSPASLDVFLNADEGVAVDDVLVTGARSRGTSPTANFNLNDLETQPSISRDIKDIVRTSAFATVDPSNVNALSIGGQNTRYNAFLVDGVRQGDDFGLNSNGYPTLNSPISMSVIQAVNVSVSPYDVQYGSFTGGVVNSVTKSGGNEFHGEVFWETTNDSLQGDTFSYTDFQTGQQFDRTLSGEFDEKTWGATLSGPIIRDRLFFLLSYEKYESVQPALTGPEGSGAPNPVPGVTQAMVDEVREIARTVYGYDAMDWSTDSITVTDEKWFGKLDWNISDRHRAVLSYQQTEGGDFRLGPNATTGAYPALALLSSSYYVNNNLRSTKAQLFSDWTDNFSTEFSVAYKEVEGITTNPGGDDFASFQVYIDDPTGSTPRPGGERSIRFGPDRSRHANSLTVDTTTYRFVANYDTGLGHRLMAGIEREEQDIFNLFVQVANAEYEFASIADFRNRIASSVGYSNAGTNVKSDAAASFGYAQNSLYVQDTWEANDVLTITLGLRADWYEMSDRPKLNPAFVSRFGFGNDTTLDGITIYQPRFGFNWRPAPGLTIYGGFGRYQGGSPNVWISNSYTNPGNLIGSFNCRISSNYSSNFANNFAVCPDASYLTNVDGLNVNPQVQAGVTSSANLGTGNINVIDPSFKTPSIWKTSLGFNKAFDLSRFGMGDGWDVTAEYVHSQLEDPIGWVDLNMLQTVNGQAPDGRPTYGPNGSSNRTQQVIMITNFKGGKTDQIALSLNKDWNEGWLEGLGFNLSYTYLDSTDPSAATSSTASSNYGNLIASDPNASVVSTSNYEIKHATKLRLSYSRAFFGDYRTRVGLFGQRRSGLPFSYTFGTSPATLFGENYTTQRQLFYVPQTDASGNVTATSDPLVRYGPTFDLAAFNAFLKSSGLINEAGSISTRNAYNSPAVTTFDLHLSQELPAFFPGGARLEAYMDIENLGNLLNDEWGVIQQVGFPYNSTNVGALNCQRSTCAGGATGNFYQYNTFTNRTASTFSTTAVWQVKLGMRYRF
ncbi:MAG: TonB-dependent receptor [Brevundimonas sp.]|uniref:TonB-dependent receptor n=1 Tax=Brevundimonas sp. TaxID=1871086 RepID=UPI0025C38EC1|nr:TonB-dependent receptor [Brevundimonas sp.]MBX3477021.1 TonB-dependent receptor [Brevundimonas sp.]